jgi:LL-diaminopimelate aminotransferase
MRKSLLPAGGENLFQRIKAQCVKAESGGMTLYRLSIGQPSGPALVSARKGAIEALYLPEESMYEYQDNGSPGVPDFAQNFIRAHVQFDLSEIGEVAYLPIPGIKPMLGIIPQACGGINGNKINMLTMTNPGYPTPAVQAGYLGMIHAPLITNVQNQFLFSPEDVHADTTDLIMVNYPHNPSGQVATDVWWRKICSFCSRHGIRLFNDAAYAILTHTWDVSTLAEVAVHFPDLSWAEAYSASKAIANGTGFRIGAICGSPDFVADIATIKGNADSGFFAPAAAGVIHAIRTDQESIQKHREKYAERIALLIDLLQRFRLKLAVEPKAGFFTLWLTPKVAFGQEIGDAETFNNLMIERTGIVGVPFGEYIRYAVTSAVEAWVEPLESGFALANVSY